MNDGDVSVRGNRNVSIYGNVITLEANDGVKVPNNTSLYIYNKPFPAYEKPDIDETYKYLTVNKDGSLLWNDVEKVSVIAADETTPGINIYSIKNLMFDDDSKVELVVDSVHPGSPDVRFKTLVDSSDNDISYNLLSTDDNKSVYFATINGH